jgi:hypothetical protein
VVHVDTDAHNAGVKPVASTIQQAVLQDAHNQLIKSCRIDQGVSGSTS